MFVRVFPRILAHCEGPKGCGIAKILDKLNFSRLYTQHSTHVIYSRNLINKNVIFRQKLNYEGRGQNDFLTKYPI